MHKVQILIGLEIGRGNVEVDFQRWLRGEFNKFPEFFCTGMVDTWKFSVLLLYILCDDWRIFMISTSNEQLQQQLEYTLLKPDCHSWWISKMQSGRDDTLEERYAIKFCFKLGKKPQKRMECFRLLLEHLYYTPVVSMVISIYFCLLMLCARISGILWLNCKLSSFSFSLI